MKERPAYDYPPYDYWSHSEWAEWAINYFRKCYEYSKKEYWLFAEQVTQRWLELDTMPALTWEDVRDFAHYMHSYSYIGNIIWGIMFYRVNEWSVKKGFTPIFTKKRELEEEWK